MSRKLDRTLNKILSEWGHDVFLQRRDEDGWSTTLEKHTVRHRYPAVRGVAQILHERAEGVVHHVDMVYYFRPEAEPKEGDRVYDDIPPRGQTTWIIDYALPMRGQGGEITYWIVGLTREEPN